MKIPYWDTTITLYSKKTELDGSVIWLRSIIPGCFFKKVITRDRINGAEFKSISSVCRIPAPYPDVKIGDIIIEGVCQDMVDEYIAGSRSTDLLIKNAGKSILVGKVHHNPRKMLGIDHLYASN